jgi:steroid delta-isomerase-like uncharacterized protein
MHPAEVARAYIAAWNSRSPEAINETFIAGGTYTDPVTDGPLTGAAIGAFAGGLFLAFPDLTFDILSLEETNSAVTLEWLMRGTNTGSLRGLPPTGASIAQPGVDVIRVNGEKVASVRGYFDSHTMLAQLGLQVVVQPHHVGPVEFGVSTRMRSGNNTVPGAFSLTMVDARSVEEVQEVRLRSREILLSMSSMPGFLSFLGVVVGRRLYTISAWTGPDEARAVMRDDVHREATSQFVQGNLCSTFRGSVWVPHHVSPPWVCCESCGRATRLKEGHSACTCGAGLPGPPVFW